MNETYFLYVIHFLNAVYSLTCSLTDRNCTVLTILAPRKTSFRSLWKASRVKIRVNEEIIIVPPFMISSVKQVGVNAGLSQTFFGTALYRQRLLLIRRHPSGRSSYQQHNLRNHHCHRKVSNYQYKILRKRKLGFKI